MSSKILDDMRDVMRRRHYQNLQRTPGVSPGVNALN